MLIDYLQYSRLNICKIDKENFENLSSWLTSSSWQEFEYIFELEHASFESMCFPSI